MSEKPVRGARQLPLTLPHRSGMTRADFLIGAANAAAIDLIDKWPDWPVPVVLLAGPVGSGKTHLAEIFGVASGATVLAAADLDKALVEPLLQKGPVAVEDIHIRPFDEAAMFHLLNRARERSRTVLLTSRSWPSALMLELPDLASRLRGAYLVELREPDDDLLRSVLAKLFADRQVAVDPAVIDYLAVRMERSLEGANAIVEDLDQEALAAGAPITRRLAALSLARVFDRQPDLFGE